MNKYLLMLFGFFFTVVAFAGNPIVNPFLSPMSPNNAYPNGLKEYLDFQKLCISGKYKQKNIDKVKTAYEQLCRNHAENKAVAMCFMGYYLLFSENNGNGMQEEGLNLISQGINTYVWNREHHPDSIATNAFRDGYLKWYIQEDFDGAKEEFLKSINLGYLPAMCELAMMNLDERWKNRNEIEFETWLQKASDAGIADI